MVKSEQNPDYSARPTVAKLKKKKKVKVILFNFGSSFSYETGISGSRRCALHPPASVSAPFYGCSKVWLQDQTKVETDVEVTEDRTGDLSLRKPTEPRLLLFLN